MDRATPHGARWTWIADDSRRGLGAGFGLRVYKSGAKSYALRYRVAGRLRFYTIGKASILSLEEARARARDLLVRIGDGEDPAADRRRSRQVKTFGGRSRDGAPDISKSDATPERLRAEADALLKLAEQKAREQEEARFAAIDMLKLADELERTMSRGNACNTPLR